MAAPRTNGMFVMGVAHIVIGAVGALLSFLMTLVCAVALVPSLMKLGGADAAETAARLHGYAVGGVLLGLLRAAVAVVLVLAGLRILDVAPAGRRLSHLAVYAWTSLNVLEAFAVHEPLWIFLVGTAYPLLVEWIFLRKDWQVAFEKPFDIGVPLPRPPRPPPASPQIAPDPKTDAPPV